MGHLNKVIIPTDFSVKSLNFVVDFLKHNSSEAFDIVLVHGYDVPQTVSDLLFFSKSKLLKKLQSNEYKDALLVIKNRFESNLKSISFDFVTNDSKAYIINYVEAQQTRKIVGIDNYTMTFKDKNSFDINAILLKIGAPNYMITHQENGYMLNTTELISDVFVINT